MLSWIFGPNPLFRETQPIIILDTLNPADRRIAIHMNFRISLIRETQLYPGSNEHRQHYKSNSTKIGKSLHRLLYLALLHSFHYYTQNINSLSKYSMMLIKETSTTSYHTSTSTKLAKQAIKFTPHTSRILIRMHFKQSNMILIKQ